MWIRVGFLVVGALVGFGVAQFITLPNAGPTDLANSSNEETREILYWVAPMDRNYRRDKPGKSPMGMDLVPVYASEESDASVVAIDPQIVQNLGVRTAVVKKGTLARRIDTVGYIEYDEDAMSHVHSRAAGWVENLGVKATGESVTEGQVLFELYSPELVNAQSEFVLTLENADATLINASKERLHALGMTHAEIAKLEETKSVKQRIKNVATMDGVVTQLGVREGTYITPATHVLSFAKLSQVWVIAEVFERQSNWIELDQKATLTLDYLPGQTWHGEVDYIYPELDPVTRTLKVRVRFENKHRLIRPNMFARVSFLAEGSEEVVHIDREAVIKGPGADRVVLALTDTRFKAVPVLTGMESEGRVEILQGLSEGDSVVVSGQFLIDSESNIDSALARISAN